MATIVRLEAVNSGEKGEKIVAHITNEKGAVISSRTLNLENVVERTRKASAKTTGSKKKGDSPATKPDPA